MKKCKIESCNGEVHCKEMCHKCYDKQYSSDHKEKRKEQKKQYYSDNKEEIKENQRQYNFTHKEYQKQYDLDHKEDKKQYLLDHKEERKEYRKQYNLEYKEKISERQKQYDLDHKEERKQYRLDHKEDKRQYRLAHKEQTNNRQRQRRKTDLSFKIMRNASNAVNKMLKKNGGSKQGKSSKTQFSFTKEQLITHIESLFSHPDNLDENGNIWMTRDNHGNYDPNKKTWHLDHIIPQSKLNFNSYEHPNFHKCWALSNLRPLEALANIKKGNKIDAI